MSGPYVTPSDSPQFGLDPSGDAWWLDGGALPAGWVAAWLAENMTLETVNVPPGSVHPDTWELWNATRAADEAGGTTDESLDWPWLRFLDGIGQILGRVTDLADDDQSTGDPGWSILLDPTRCPTYALPWLAQFVGVRFAVADNTDAAQRSAILNKQGFARGTPGALQAAIAPYLAGAGTMAIINERDTSAYHLTVTVVASQTGDAFYYTLSAEYPTYADFTADVPTYADITFPVSTLTAAVEAATPGALIVDVRIVSSEPYSELTSEFATYTDFTAALPTYAAVSAHTG